MNELWFPLLSRAGNGYNHTHHQWMDNHSKRNQQMTLSDTPNSKNKIKNIHPVIHTKPVHIIIIQIKSANDPLGHA
jgi:hypothetical protein